MSFKLYTNANNAQAAKALIAARYTGKTVEVPAFNFGVDNTTPEFLKKQPLGKVPVLETATGCVFEANAIARYIARGTAFYGKSEFEAALVDQWIDFAANELELPLAAWLLPYTVANVPRNDVAEKRARSDVRKAMAALNAQLVSRTFLVGERVTLADVAVACGMLEAYRVVLDPGFRREFRALNRWFETIVNQPHVKEVLGEVKLCEKAPQPPKVEAAPAAEGEQQHHGKKEKKEKKEEKPKKEKAAKKEEEEAAAGMDDEDEDKPKEKKAPNPLDLLPPSKFVMDAWKRTYSNEDTLKVAAPWFFENYDPEGYSLWWADYKYELDQSQVFMVANLVGGFIQRMDPIRKYGFASLIIFGEAKPWEIHGLFLFRGKEIPKEMKEVDDYELYNWKPADVAADKEKIIEYLSWEGKFDGKKFNQAKIFK